MNDRSAGGARTHHPHLANSRRAHTMTARRCSLCAINWPATLKIGDTPEQFLTCPKCDTKTDYFFNSDPIDDDDARSQVLHIRFETYYEQHEAKRQAEEGRRLADELAQITKGSDEHTQPSTDA